MSIAALSSFGLLRKFSPQRYKFFFILQNLFTTDYAENILIQNIWGKYPLSCSWRIERGVGYKQEYKVNFKPTKGAIDNELRKAARQAKHVVIRIDSSIDLLDLTRGIKGRVSQSEIQEVIVIFNGKDLFLSREAILSNGFLIQQKDFK